MQRDNVEPVDTVPDTPAKEHYFWKLIATVAVVVLLIAVWSNIDLRSSLGKERKAKVKVTKELKDTNKQLKTKTDELKMYESKFETWMERAKKVDKLQRENNEKQEALNEKLADLISQKIEQRRVRYVASNQSSNRIQPAAAKGNTTASSNLNSGGGGGSGNSGVKGQYLGEFESTGY